MAPTPPAPSTSSRSSTSSASATAPATSGSAASDAGYGGPDRRENVLDTRHPGTGLERRRGAGIRRHDFVKAAEEGEMTPEQFLFIKAVDAYKRVNQRPFPTWTEVLEILRKLGYRKTAATVLEIPGAEDWLEEADAPVFLEPADEADDAASGAEAA